jgi:hypothetical protein
VSGDDARRAAYEAEQAELSARLAVTSAESTVASARIADLAERQRAAWRRHSAAKGLLTRAMKDGNAEKIAVARARERAAYAEADETAREGIEEMQSVNGAALQNLGGVLHQMGRTGRLVMRGPTLTSRPGNERGEEAAAGLRAGAARTGSRPGGLPGRARPERRADPASRRKRFPVVGRRGGIDPVPV